MNSFLSCSADAKSIGVIPKRFQSYKILRIVVSEINLVELFTEAVQTQFVKRNIGLGYSEGRRHKHLVEMTV